MIWKVYACIVVLLAAMLSAAWASPMDSPWREPDDVIFNKLREVKKDRAGKHVPRRVKVQVVAGGIAESAATVSNGKIDWSPLVERTRFAALQRTRHRLKLMSPKLAELSEDLINDLSSDLTGTNPTLDDRLRAICGKLVLPHITTATKEAGQMIVRTAVPSLVDRYSGDADFDRLQAQSILFVTGTCIDYGMLELARYRKRFLWGASVGTAADELRWRFAVKNAPVDLPLLFYGLWHSGYTPADRPAASSAMEAAVDRALDVRVKPRMQFASDGPEKAVSWPE